MTFKNSCVKINGTLYTDVTIYSDHGRGISNNTIIIDDSLFSELNDKIRGLKNETFVPALGSDIHVVPDCPIPTQTLRNNYNLKRNLDSGCCNVFSKIQSTCHHKYIQRFLFDPINKILLFSNANYWQDVKPESFYTSKCLQVAPPDIINNSYEFHSECISVYIGKIHQSYLDFLFDRCKKPCILSSNLPLSKNELTVDMLQMVLSSGRQECSKDNKNSFVMVLSTLSQYDWKKYPYSIRFIKDLLGESYNSVYRDISATPSQMSKAVSDFYKFSSSISIIDATAEDKNFALQLCNSALGIFDTKYVSYRDLCLKIIASCISEKYINELYDIVVRIKPKEFV